ncbi:unnamed protein product [Porites evermanni]|uniref:ZU5 domain-containing protein n=1 Tax=Porites evermanni TaxID=104178 RepID=A0ABN8QZY7_9CNID|nr:unnamed protein product [Porites evermanni]
MPTEESDAAGVAVEEDKGAGSHGGSDEQVDVESAVNETETESEDYAEEEKEDVEVHEQVAELACVEAIGGFLKRSEEEIEGESVNESDSSGDDAEGQNVTEEESGRIVTSKGTDWANRKLGVHLMFPPDAVSEPTPLMVHRWKYSVCSPLLLEHEAITSNVIELSSMDRQKIEDDFPSHVEIPDLFFPVAQADITECSTYAVVCRLKPSPTYTITSKGCSFSHPDYPGVTVTIPENAVAPNAEFPLELQVQEVSNEEFEGEGVFLGPVLRINCSEGVQFLKPVTIQLPIPFESKKT